MTTPWPILACAPTLLTLLKSKGKASVQNHNKAQIEQKRKFRRCCYYCCCCCDILDYVVRLSLKYVFLYQVSQKKVLAFGGPRNEKYETDIQN